MSVIQNVLDCKAGHNGSQISGFCDEMALEELIPEWVNTTDHFQLMFAMFGSILVGLSGVLPLLVISIDQSDNLKHGDKAYTLKTLLSFAVGGILGDVFLHSLPEIWANDVAKGRGIHNNSLYSGLLVLSGLMVFVITEKVFSVITKIPETDDQDDKTHSIEQINNNVKGYYDIKKPTKEESKKKITGYLNLLANTIDNFTHGLSLGGAFLVSSRIGFLTTFAILLHEIPHEVGDFAILLKSGFSRWEAGVLQLTTASGGLIGSMFAIACSGAANSIEARTSWILPFTAGTFLYIGLVTVLPDLLKEENPKESLKQFTALILGITIMACVTIISE